MQLAFAWKRKGEGEKETTGDKGNREDARGLSWAPI